MIKEGSHLFIDGRGSVEPFKGKYAVKRADVFDLVRQGWESAGLGPELAYRPLRIEFELTTKCNDTCISCGMGKLPMNEGVTLTAQQTARLLDEFESVALPAVAVTGGEPFAAPHALFDFIRRARGRIDISKLTTNAYWGTPRRIGFTFDRLVQAGLLENRLFVPLLMVSVGEQTTPLEDVNRVIHHTVHQFTDHELNIAVSSLADPATREHRVDELMALYERTYDETFPHDRVHSTMRVYLPNERLGSQAEIHRPGHTPVDRWMNHCYDCFAPTVGAYVLPTALMKQDGRLYSCAAFNVPEKLAFGNLAHEPLRTIVERANTSAYLKRVRDGGGLKALHGVVSAEFTENTTCGSFCGSCALLMDEHERVTGQPEPGGPNLPLIPAQALLEQARTRRTEARV